MVEELTLSPAIGWRGVFYPVQRHGELGDLAFRRGNMGLVLGNDAGFNLLIVQFAAMELRQPY